MRDASWDVGRCWRVWAGHRWRAASRAISTYGFLWPQQRGQPSVLRWTSARRRVDRTRSFGGGAPTFGPIHNMPDSAWLGAPSPTGCSDSWPFPLRARGRIPLPRGRKSMWEPNPSAAGRQRLSISGLPILDRRHIAVLGAGVIGAGADDAVVGALLHDVRAPAGYPRHHEDRREQARGN